MLNARDPRALAGEHYDVIIVGGGIYGIMTALEAVRRDLRPLLVERADFGGATSHNSLRIVHGGLRYLQSCDLHRFRESVEERRWFLRTFPDLVRPLPCVMPLYGDGLRRPWILGCALALNDTLSWRRNSGVRADRHLPRGRLMSADAVAAAFPGVDRAGLRGGAVWYDASFPDAPRMVMETLRWACAHGAKALNYVSAEGLLEGAGGVAGIRAVDRLSGETLEFRADKVFNAAGPWCRAFSALCGDERPALFAPSIAWNVVFRRDALSEYAIAVTPKRRGAQTYFLVPWKGVLFAGTGHAVWQGGPDDVAPGEALLRTFIDDINHAIPGLDLGDGDIARVFAGLLPAARPGSADLSVREVLVDHGAAGGPAGLYSVSGVKFTASRRVADKVMRRAFPAARRRGDADFARPDAVPVPDHPFTWMPGPGDDWQAALGGPLAGEAVVHLDDLLLRRSSLGDNPERAARLAGPAAGLFDWDEARRRREIAALTAPRQRAGTAAAEAG